MSSERVITTSEEFHSLSRGAVLVSPNYTDAMSVVSLPPIRGKSYGTCLMNAATGHKCSLAEVPDFLPATVIYDFEWSHTAGANE